MYPWSLDVALQATGYITPGDTLYLRGGTYSGDYTCDLVGTAEAPIQIKPYPGERVIVDGNLTINGADTHWHDLEFTQMTGPRHTDIAGSNPGDIPLKAVSIFGDGINLINCVIYDNGNGIGWWTPANGGELYGCIFLNNGWEGPDRGNGHNLYTQNAASSAAKVIKHCLMGACFAMHGDYNLTLYGTGATALQHYDLVESVFYGSNLIGGDAPVDDVDVSRCHIRGSLILGWHDDDHVNASIVNTRIGNLSLCPLYPSFFRNLTISGNTITLTAQDNVNVLLNVAEPIAGIGTWTYTGNAYHYTGQRTQPFYVDQVGVFNFAQWQARYSTDADSTYSTALPADSTHVYPNEYDAARALIVVWNWSGADMQVVDVAGVYAAGERVELRSGVDYFGDRPVVIVAANGTITVDMRATAHSVAVPRDWDMPLMDNPFPIFGSFIAVKL